MPISKTKSDPAAKHLLKIKKDAITRILHAVRKQEINWPREIKLINKIYLQYPKEEFWQNLNITFFIPSFAWFLTPNGKQFLGTEYRRATTDLSQLVQKKPLPIIAPIVSSNNQTILPHIGKKNILTLKDFLNKN